MRNNNSGPLVIHDSRSPAMHLSDYGCCVQYYGCCVQCYGFLYVPLHTFTLLFYQV